MIMMWKLEGHCTQQTQQVGGANMKVRHLWHLRAVDGSSGVRRGRKGRQQTQRLRQETSHFFGTANLSLLRCLGNAAQLLNTSTRRFTTTCCARSVLVTKATSINTAEAVKIHRTCVSGAFNVYNTCCKLTLKKNKFWWIVFLKKL